ncbi:AAA family ATPase [Hungatella hathewayi]|jgi:predicted AAA+ superfamily ATPase|uniref:AAA family ATPase n=1 Tax=Hungatella hathewayi TaxID=154046 RepID=UPI000E507366|nr:MULTISPECIES: AAA family ATPase [Hungatella]MBS6755673.1 AAA family ATPase [Hungatella hathewayi]MCI6451083.1 AAA family ATPase [Hungatella sp.]MDU4974121.1 AAA family ATPase [Hungatella hathewayi]RHB70448.1 hypothetical protein DW876_13360 [Hungatella hathewayi]UWO87591.1 AAA family ATPase [Hungatella hathewayi]
MVSGRQQRSFFVDKSLLIEEINKKISTKEKFICVSRSRRFGKTMALEMLASYYIKEGDCGLFIQ